jgi:hypothetical protein
VTEKKISLKNVEIDILIIDYDCIKKTTVIIWFLYDFTIYCQSLIIKLGSSYFYFSILFLKIQKKNILKIDKIIEFYIYFYFILKTT